MKTLKTVVLLKDAGVVRSFLPTLSSIHIAFTSEEERQEGEMEVKIKKTKKEKQKRRRT